MKTINLIFPHQLFQDSILIENEYDVYLIEEYLFFKQYPFHKQKIAFHRASMKCYQNYLQEKGKKTFYIDSNNTLSDIRNFKSEIEDKNIGKINLIDPTDNWLLKRIQIVAKGIELSIYDNPLFINKSKDIETFFRAEKKSFFQTTFYKQQRKKLGLLIDKEGLPFGGKWTYDIENRKKYPKNKKPPKVQYIKTCSYWKEAVSYTNKNFPKNLGKVDEIKRYPINFQESDSYFNTFLTDRFLEFGDYEDAILKESSSLHHSLLSPLMNVGLLMPLNIVKKSVIFAEKNNVPINSTEGFIRQIIGWREFIRGMYQCRGSFSRTRNFWSFKRKIPSSFYDGTTGIEPIDNTIKRLLKTGYCHHIERLMVLGNFMLLCEFDPDDVYKWFMELFIDAYDWVMVPNVYGMSLFSDGGTFATKPYIGGSNYIRKMSNYKSGEWCDIWDGLFWRFISKNESFFKKNPRTNMMVVSFSKMEKSKKIKHLEIAEAFLNGL